MKCNATYGPNRHVRNACQCEATFSVTPRPEYGFHPRIIAAGPLYRCSKHLGSWAVAAWDVKRIASPAKAALESRQCPECSRSFGPHYRGKCEH